MKTKEEIKKWLLENCISEDGNLDLSELDFSDFEGDVLLCNMKVKENLYQYAQEVSNDLFQSNQKVKGNLYQDYQEVKSSLYQEKQKAQGVLYQNSQEVKGTIFQDNVANKENNMETKDPQFTYEELTALCRRQEDYIEELETKLEKLRTPSCTEKCDEHKSTYDELCRQIQSLSWKVETLGQENNALRYSLTKMHIQLEGSQAREEIWEEEYYKEHSRAEHLGNELREQLYTELIKKQ